MLVCDTSHGKYVTCVFAIAFKWKRNLMRLTFMAEYTVALKSIHSKVEGHEQYTNETNTALYYVFQIFVIMHTYVVQFHCVLV